MRRAIYLLALLACLMPCSARGDSPVATGSLKECTYELPNDSGKVYLTVVGTTRDQRFKDLCGLFDSTPEWKELQDDTQFTKLDTNSILYMARYATDYRDFPTIRLQTAGGDVVREWSGRDIPASDDLMASLKAECFRRHRQEHKQSVDKSVDKSIDKSVDKTIDKTVDKTDTRPRELQGDWPSGTCIALSMILGFVVAWYADWQNRTHAT